MPKDDKSKVKKGLSSFDIQALVEELQILVGYRIEKVFHYPSSPMEMQLKVNLVLGKRELQVNVGSWLYLSDTEPKRPSEGADRLTVFAQVLRKHLSNGKIMKLAQHGFDRIIEFTVEQGGNPYLLTFEMFGTGNVVLVENGVIVAVLSTQIMRDRSLKAGAEYAYPPSRENLRELGKERFVEILKNSSKDIVRALALDLNMGGTYAEELCIRTEIDKKRNSAGLGSGEYDRLFSALELLLKDCGTGKHCEIILDQNGNAIDIQPCHLEVYSGNKRIETTNFNEGIPKYAEMIRGLSGEDARISEESSKLKRKLEQQRNAIRSIEAEIDKATKTAEALYGHRERIEQTVTLLRNARERKKLDNVMKLLKNRNQVKSVDPAEWSYTFGIPMGGEETDIKISISKNFHENVGDYFEKAKKDRERLIGAKDAFNRTLKELEDLSGKAAKIVGKKERAGHARSMWFEQYRWFISSDGIIVVAGKDAASNDKVVKKYLREGDRYAHAEVHGAPSVVVKKGDGEIPEATLKEACEFALAFSKAWNQKQVHGSAYWVTPEQVSKTPNTGEYVPKGGFIIRGKKNFYDVRLQCAVGEIEHNGEEKIMCGPVSAVKAKAKKYATIEPGDTDKNTTARELAAIFGSDQEELQRLLPPGDAKIVEKMGF